MNTLSTEEKVSVLSAMVEGNSIRSVERMTGIHRDTIMRLVVRTGENCTRIMDERMRGIRSQCVQVDEIWTFVGIKEKRLTQSHDAATMGDQYVFIAMDADTKLVPSFIVGKRSATNAYLLMKDLESRLVTRVQLTTDGFRPYINAVDDTFGTNVDYAMLIKTYQGVAEQDTRYSPDQIVNAVPIPVMGDPKPWSISTSHIERQNLTIRMQLRRFTRLTNAFSKKLENLKAACALHFAWYNFCRVHQSLRVTPAMAASIADQIWPLSELLA
jgi:IS1 family transposase